MPFLLHHLSRETAYSFFSIVSDMSDLFYAEIACFPLSFPRFSSPTFFFFPLLFVTLCVPSADLCS